ncbi:related to trna methyltransferase [Ustilago trichophora]|uniref:tRNA-5-taurinomethyluridine 2-sulfurtransferase n=1 Tax=Ustilago trichophora TaxID=86804 RepID=A0A5C3DRQ0_9BASI|nr:related to trna methyltransferase [Ustilago trichophora]
MKLSQMARAGFRVANLPHPTGLPPRPFISASSTIHLTSRPYQPVIQPLLNPPSHLLRFSYTTSCSPALPPHGPQKGDSITIALSGGVDSSVTALLLAQSSHFELSAVFMRNWNELDESLSFHPGSGGASGCSWQKDWEDVQSVARHLGIPVRMVDLSKEYWTQVFEPALGEWRDGVTPNPDVGCNREIKFGALMDRVLPPDQGGGKKSWLATGHYANIAWAEVADGKARPMLTRAKDRTKDQTYYLSSVGEERLAHAHFPLANLLKSEVRELAKKYDLPTANRRESMGICFIGTRGSNKSVSHKDGFSSFLGGYIPSIPGNIIDGDTGAVVSSHSGLHTLTVGQGARIRGATSKYYVAKKDIPNNSIVVVQGKTHPMLMCTELRADTIEWTWNEPPPELQSGGKGKVELLAQVRHRQTETECTVTRSKDKDGGGYVVRFKEPVLAVAPGQVLGLWKGDWCLGSGVISSVQTMFDEQVRETIPSARIQS